MLNNNYNNNRNDRNDRSRRNNRAILEKDRDNILSEVIKISRVSCTTTGGRKMSFRVYVAVGDGKGSIGIGMGKSTEVPDAINKAERQARKNIFRIPIYKTTIIHDCVASFNATKIILKKARMGTGFKTCGTIKTILSLGGIENLVSKVYGSTNINNILCALLKALKSLETLKQIAHRRGKTIADITQNLQKNKEHSTERIQL
jgi:small subunit ribosomal protein S5